jgi:hypothetical protein
MWPSQGLIPRLFLQSDIIVSGQRAGDSLSCAGCGYGYRSARFKLAQSNCFEQSRLSRLRGDRSKPVWGRFHCCRSTPRSISQPLIDNVLQGFALLKPAILLQKEAHRLILPVGRVVRAVRRQQNILQLVQQMSRRKRFVLKHI